MPIRIRLDRLLVQKRMSLTELADRVGVTIANLSILKTGKARAIRFRPWPPSAGNSIASRAIWWLLNRGPPKRNDDAWADTMGGA